jgi:peptide deformylase
VLIFFGNPLLRKKARRLNHVDIRSHTISKLSDTIVRMISTKDFGVGLAAPQIGESIALAVIDIKPTKNRPNAQPFHAVIINPTYSGIGTRASMWEGCLSSGMDDNTLYGKALRYKKIEAIWMDIKGTVHKEILHGLPSQVFQHETDHLNGILFVDKVRDTTSYMLANEYRKRIVPKK